MGLTDSKRARLFFFIDEIFLLADTLAGGRTKLVEGKKSYVITCSLVGNAKKRVFWGCVFFGENSWKATYSAGVLRDVG